MRQDLPTTSYALLGLLALGDGLTGYELKQRADRTMRFYWVSPAMSQVYSELARLAGRGLVATDERSAEGRRGTRYRITTAGREALQTWLGSSDPEFPVLKHPVALRLMMAALDEPEHVVAMLREHLARLAQRRADLERVRESLRGRDRDGQGYRYPALVAEWGLDYFDAERATVERLLARLQDAAEHASGGGDDVASPAPDGG